METKNLPLPKQHARNRTAGLLSTARVVRLLLVLLVMLSAVVHAQDFAYETIDDTITITGYTGPGGAVSIPDTIDGLPVTSIGNYAFSGCTSLTSVTIGKEVTSIGQGAFNSCASLEAFTVAADNSTYGSVDGVLFDKSQTALIRCPQRKNGNYTIPSNVTSISYLAFSGCIRLTGVTFSNNVISIGQGAFAHCTSVARITIPNSVTGIGSGAFDGCTSLTSVTIPGSVTHIGNETFYNCYSLMSVTIPSSVTFIGDEAFWGCTSLASVTIGNGVTGISYQAFAFCTSLNGVYFQGNAPSVDSSAFVGATVTVYYLAGTTGWGPTYGGRPTALWALQLQAGDSSLGVRTNQFGFNITWASGKVVVVEACPDLSQPIWTPVGTNTLTDGSSYFSDPQWTNHPARFYRLRSL